MKKRSTKIIAASMALFLFVSTAMVQAEELSVENIVRNIRQQKELVKSYEAEIVTELVGPFVDGKQVQKAYIYEKGEHLSRTDTFTPIKQTTLKNNNGIFIIDELGNIKEIKGEEKEDNKLYTPETLMDHLEFVLSKSGDALLLEGTPKAGDTFLSSKKISKVVFSIDKDKKVVNKAELFMEGGKRFIEIVIEYQEFDAGIYFPKRSISTVWLPDGLGQMVVDTRYEKTRINNDIPDEIFDLEEIKRSLGQGEEK